MKNIEEKGLCGNIRLPIVVFAFDMIYVICSTKEIWEIKPNNPHSIIMGNLQLMNYTLNSMGGYHPGGPLLEEPMNIPLTNSLSIDVVQQGSLILYTPKLDPATAPETIPVIHKDMVTIPDSTKDFALETANDWIWSAIGVGAAFGFAGSKDPVLQVIR